MQAHPIILGSANVGELERNPPDTTASGLTQKLLGWGVVPILIIVAFIRYNPRTVVRLRERVMGDAGRRKQLPLPAKSLRPRPRGYDRVATARDDSPSPPRDSAIPQCKQPKPSKPAQKAEAAQRLRPVPRDRDRGRGAPEAKEQAPSAARGQPPAAPEHNMAERTRATDARTVQSHPVAHVDEPQAYEHIAPFHSNGLVPGMKIRVHGLQRAMEHNGKQGVLIAPIITAEHGSRWNIRMESGELLALRQQNLEPCAESPSLQSMADALDRAGETNKAALLRSMIPEEDDP